MGEGGALGKYTGKMKHSKIKILTMFLILGRSIVYIYTKYEENPFAGFFNPTIVGKFFGNF